MQTFKIKRFSVDYKSGINQAKIVPAQVLKISCLPIFQFYEFFKKKNVKVIHGCKARVFKPKLYIPNTINILINLVSYFSRCFFIFLCAKQPHCSGHSSKKLIDIKVRKLSTLTKQAAKHMKLALPYARHYKPRLVYFLPHFQRPFLCFLGGFLKKNLPLCMACIQERLLIKSGL